MVNTPFPFIAGGIIAPNVNYPDFLPINYRISIFSCMMTGKKIYLAEWFKEDDYFAQAVRLEGDKGAEFLKSIMQRRDFEHYSLHFDEFFDLAEMLGIWSQSGSGCPPIKHYLLHPAVQRRSLWVRWRPLFMDVRGDIIEGASISQLKYYLSPNAEIETEEEEVE